MTDYKIIDQSLKIDSCLECGTIFYGRTNKVFCCEACKNRYHNRKYQEIRNVKLRVRHILEKNYTILSGLVSDKISSIGRDELMLKGFNPEYVTGCMRMNKRELCYCYDIPDFDSLKIPFFLRSDNQYIVKSADFSG